MGQGSHGKQRKEMKMKKSGISLLGNKMKDSSKSMPMPKKPPPKAPPSKDSSKRIPMPKKPGR